MNLNIKSSTYNISDGITNSMLSKYLKCRVAFMLSMNGIYKKTPKFSIGFGSLSHNFLEYYYNHCPTIILKSKIRKIAEDYINKNENDYNIFTEYEINRMIELSILLNYYYQIFYKNDKIKIIEAEKKFDVQWNDYRMRGMIDLKYKDKHSNIWLMEHKNLSRIDHDMENILKLNSQNLYYITAEESFGEKIYGTMYNILRVPQIKIKKDNLNQYIKQIADEINGNRKYYFIRYSLIYTQRERKDFKENLLKIFKEIKFFLNYQKFYKNYSACSGRYPCDYIDYCINNNTSGYKTDGITFKELGGK